MQNLQRYYRRYYVPYKPLWHAAGRVAYNAAESYLKGGGAAGKKRMHVASKIGPSKRRRFNVPIVAPKGVSGFVSARTYAGHVYTSRKRRRVRRAPVSRKVKKYMKGMIRGVTSSEAKNVYRSMSSGYESVAVNQVKYGRWAFLSTADVATAIAQAKTINIDDTTGATVTTETDLTATARDTRILNGKLTFVFRNNDQMPIWLEFWQLLCINNAMDTTDPLVIWEDEMKDNGAIASVLTDPRYNFYDGLGIVKKYWKKLKHRKVLLNAGDEITISLNKHKPFNYDPDDTIATSNDYLKGITQMLVTRLHGVVSHDQTTHTQVGTSSGTVDYVATSHIKFEGRHDTNYKKFNTGSISLGAQAAGAAVAGPDVEEIKDAL